LQDWVATVKRISRDVVTFAFHLSGLRLRSYQEAVARAVADSVIHQRGMTFVVMFPRQSGKNELQAQIETYLLNMLCRQEAEMVKVSPTWKPQSLNAMRRLERVLARNILSKNRWKKEQGYIYRVETARIYFLSGGPTANVVGATASALLECDEAQDVLIEKWDKDFNPMAASTNATRVFWGTAWTSQTLLARELRAAREAERADGIQRVFVMDADQVRKEAPAYGKFVDGEIQKLGRQHPMIKTQFFSEEIDGEGGMFPPRRRKLMVGDHPRREGPFGVGRIYALLIDVAGEDEGISDLEFGIANLGSGNLENEKRDATALTVVEVDLATLADESLRAPVYRVVDRMLWVGVKHTTLFGQILALFEMWRAAYIIVDATGVGAGLASFLEKAAPGKVCGFTFNAATKSKLGWDFLALIETGRFKDWRESPLTPLEKGGIPPQRLREHGDILNGVEEKEDLREPRKFHSRGHRDERAMFWEQVEACQMEIVPGPERKMRWGVPDGRRNPATGEALHDDLLISAALCAELDALYREGKIALGLANSEVVPAEDPIEGLGEAF
jgi:hypothetical protein